MDIVSRTGGLVLSGVLGSGRVSWVPLFPLLDLLLLLFLFGSVSVDSRVAGRQGA